MLHFPLNAFHFFEPFDSLFDGTGTNPECFGASMDDETDWIINGRYYLGNFEMNLPLDLFLGWAEHEGVIMEAEVVFRPSGEEPLPHL